MAFYRTIALICGLILIAVSFFMFLEERDNNGRAFLFLAVYTYIGLFYSLKALYYLRHRATFNEISFVVFIPIVPLLLVFLGSVTDFDNLYFSDFLKAQVTFPSRVFEFELSFSSILALPYLFFSIYLLLRTFMRYEFIRWGSHSKGGPNAVFVGLLLSIIVGLSYFIFSIILEDLLLALFGFVYAIVGIFGFLA